MKYILLHPAIPGSYLHCKTKKREKKETSNSFKLSATVCLNINHPQKLCDVVAFELINYPRPYFFAYLSVRDGGYLVFR